MGRITRRIGTKVIDTTSEYFDLTHEELVHALFERLAAYEDISETPEKLQLDLDLLGAKMNKMNKALIIADNLLGDLAAKLKNHDDVADKVGAVFKKFNTAMQKENEGPEL